MKQNLKNFLLHHRNQTDLLYYSSLYPCERRTTKKRIATIGIRLLNRHDLRSYFVKLVRSRSGEHFLINKIKPQKLGASPSWSINSVQSRVYFCQCKVLDSPFLPGDSANLDRLRSTNNQGSVCWIIFVIQGTRQPRRKIHATFPPRSSSPASKF